MWHLYVYKNLRGHLAMHHESLALEVITRETSLKELNLNHHINR